MGPEEEDREEVFNTWPDEETVVRERKRSRRVSFAEITSVHVFDRDEDYETPPDSKPNHPETPELLLGQSNQGLVVRRGFPVNDDLKDHGHGHGEDDENDERELFVRCMDSSSPGSAAASATSNDEDNFFGPVSASFIRSGCLSDSAASDDNHDVTLDSTAFSLHFQSLMQSDSVGNLKTPTSVHSGFGDKTPTQSSMLSKSGNSMVLTEAKKLNATHSTPGGKSSAGSDSNNMSLVEVNPHRYDYGRLSPTLNAILGDSEKDIQVVSMADEMSISKSSSFVNLESKFSMLIKNKFELTKLKNFGDREVDGIETLQPVTETVSSWNDKFEESGESAKNPIENNSYYVSGGSKETIPSHASSPHQYQILQGERQEMPFGSDNALASRKCKASEMGHELFGGNNNIATPLRNSGQINSTSDCDNHPIANIYNPEKGKSPNGGMYTPNIHLSSGARTASPAQGSVSLLRAKIQESLVDASISSKSERTGTPFARKQPYSSPGADIRLQDNLSSIKNHISELKVLEKSPLVGMQELGGNSKTKPLDHFAKHTSFATVLGDVTPISKHTDISVVGSEDHPSSLAQEKVEDIVTTAKESRGHETPKDIALSEQNAVPVLEKKQSYQLSSGKFQRGQVVEMVVEMSGYSEGMQSHILASQDHNQSALVRTEPASPSTSISCMESIQAVGNNVSHSPLKTFEEKLNASIEHEARSRRTLDHVNEGSKFYNLGNRLNPADVTLENDAPSSHSTPIDKVVTDLGSSLEEKRQPPLSFLDINIDRSNEFDMLKGLSAKYSRPSKSQKEIGITGDHQTPLKLDNSIISMYKRLESFRSRTDPFKFKEKTSERASFYGSVSPDVHRRTATAIRLEKMLGEGVQSSLRKEVHNMSKNEFVHPIFTITKSPLVSTTVKYSSGNIPSPSHQNWPNSQEPHSMQDAESSRRKRRIEEITVMNKQKIGESGSTHKIPKVDLGTKSGALGFESEQYVAREKDSGRTGSYGSSGLINVFSRFSGAFKDLHFPSAGKFCSWEIGTLADMLGQLQMAKKYGMLCFDIQSQKMHDHMGLQERVSRARRLQQMVIYGQAKLHLLRMKQEKLLREAKLLQSGITEAKSLKFSLRNICSLNARNTWNNDFSCPSLSGDTMRKKEVAYCEMLAKRRTLGELDEKVKNVTKLLQAYCKTKRELSPSETILLVNDNLRKRTRSSYIQEELQLWQVDDLEGKNGSHSFLINYRCLLVQRFTVNLHSIPTITKLNTLNESNIMKSFPNINAIIAFTFVFNATGAQKLGSSKSLAGQTQITSSLLGNLLDVVAEVQRASIECRNLSEKSFCLPHAEQLELRFCFVSFNTGHKVTLTLDTTCLKCAVYPSDTHYSISITPASPSFLAEIGSAIGALKARHSRIIGLCKCISHIVQAQAGRRTP
ncbi:hypothetical protein Sjap_024979 [Stephania japonica]|uniref:Knl1 C-terminal RWD domain-containing protein n=1 Tax=Stephania japonica TaxID=461633 RepID=A0AAP0HDR3_9MAGN